MCNLPFPARLIRLRDAPAYLGMDRNRFNDEVRPNLTQLTIGKQGIAFDRLELDEWANNYIKQFKKSTKSKGLKRNRSWEGKNRPAYSKEVESGTSTKSSQVIGFAEAAAQVISKKRKLS